jgi:hypothetical protein
MSPEYHAAIAPAVFTPMQAPTPNVAQIAVSSDSEDDQAAAAGLATARRRP